MTHELEYDVPVLIVGRRAGRARGRPRARTPRHPIAARRAARRDVAAAAGHRRQHPLHGADPHRGGWRRRCARARSTSSWLMLRVRDARTRRRGYRDPGRHADTGADRPRSAPSSRRACRRITSRPCCCATCVPTAARAPSSRPRSSAWTTGPTACVPFCGTQRAGDERVVRARYVVAADGAHSTVRRALGIPMRGPDHLAEVVTALFRAPLWDVVGEHRHGIYSVIRPDAMGASSCPPERDDRWLYGVYWDPGRARRPTSTRSGCCS